MTTKQAVEYFGGIKQLADVLGIWPQTIYSWGERPPKGRQYEIAAMSALKVDKELTRGRK